MKTEIEIGWDGSLPDREERELFPETFAARRAAMQIERRSFLSGGPYVTFDTALTAELRKRQNAPDQRPATDAA